MKIYDVNSDKMHEIKEREFSVHEKLDQLTKLQIQTIMLLNKIYQDIENDRKN